jgi:uncharacterized spore protein YtfJ
VGEDREDKKDLFFMSLQGHEDAMDLMKKLTEVAQPGSVYGAPLTVGEHTIITAAEVSTGLGFGYGMGNDQSCCADDECCCAEGAKEGQETGEEPQEAGQVSVGSGGGGGGGSSARPVAVIDISEEGVRVEPVVDATKIALAFFTMLGSIFLIGGKMKKAARKGLR